MNVLKNNFERLLPSIIEDIKKADFIAFDCEFTGLGLDKRDRIDVMDSLQERYEKVASVCGQYLPLQVGICTFEYKEEGSFYVAKPYNFHIFPRTGNRMFGLDRAFKSQVSSLQFLMSHKFDMKTWAEEGISFVNRDDEERILERLDIADKIDPAPSIDESIFAFYSESRDLIQDFIQNSTEASITIKTPSTYHKRILHQSAARDFNGCVSTSSDRSSVIIKKLSNDERKDLKEKARGFALREELNELVGFRKVIDAIIEAQRPVVGHNLYMDLCFIYQNFYRNLPTTFTEFQEQVHTIFPTYYLANFRIIDTKLIAHTAPTLQAHIINTVLTDIAQVFTDNSDFVLPKIVFECGAFESYSGDTGAYHEAGYDAYITGLSLLRMVAHLSSHKSGVMDHAFTSSNKIFFMRSIMTFIPFAGPEDIADTSNIFKLSRFPVNWRAGDIQHAFKTLGQINIKWIDDDSCLLIVKDRSKVSLALDLLQVSDPLYRFQKYSAMDEAIEERLIAEPRRKRQREEESVEIQRKKKGCVLM